MLLALNAHDNTPSLKDRITQHIQAYLFLYFFSAGPRFLMKKLANMASSFSSNFLHLVWSTKNRQPLISPVIEKKLHRLMQEEFESKGCRVLIINGTFDHVHCLIKLHPSRSEAEVVQYAKGVSSRYINESDIIEERFGWQQGYYSVSVSPSLVKKTYRYIERQKIHHELKDFDKEMEAFSSQKMKNPSVNGRVF
jgi:putative transposase